MDEKIKNALVCLLNEEVIVSSWGVTNLNINDMSFMFEVSGFLFQGKVEVIPCESGYSIKLNNADITKCSLEELVRTLDSIIESVDNYESLLQKWLDSK